MAILIAQDGFVNVAEEPATNNGIINMELLNDDVCDICGKNHIETIRLNQEDWETEDKIHICKDCIVKALKLFNNNSVALNFLRRKAASSPTGVIQVSIEELNQILEEIPCK